MSLLLGEIAVRTPFPWAHLLNYLSQRLVPGLESIESGEYRRRCATGTLCVGFDASRQVLVVKSDVPMADAPGRIAQLFAVDHDSHPVSAHLSRSPELAPRLSAVPGMRPIGAWSGFELCLRTVIGQQVTVAAARTLMQRIVERCRELTPEGLLEANLDNVGMPGKRVQTLLTLARAVTEERVRFELPWPQVDAALQTLPGFGPWTRAYLAIRLGREPDAFPETDLGLVRAAQVESPKALLARAAAWRPYRAYAATYLWSVALT